MYESGVIDNVEGGRQTGQTKPVLPGCRSPAPGVYVSKDLQNGGFRRVVYSIRRLEVEELRCRSGTSPAADRRDVQEAWKQLTG